MMVVVFVIVEYTISRFAVIQFNGRQSHITRFLGIEHFSFLGTFRGCVRIYVFQIYHKPGVSHMGATKRYF